MSTLLKVQDLEVGFRRDDQITRVVDGISLEIGAGETLALVGESGSGKSVSALAVMGLLPSSSAVIPKGSIHLDGADLLANHGRLARKHRGRKMAMVFQDPLTSLNPFMTVGRQVMEVPGLGGRLWSPSKRRARVVDLFREVGIPDPEQRFRSYPHELSGGLRQRVLICMALAADPQLIIADEPTTALDVTVQAQILTLFRDLCRERGTALLLITHDLGVVAGMAERVAVMYSGRIVEAAPVRELFADPRHPYTRGLLDSLPNPHAPTGSKLLAIDGFPPDPAHRPSGCAFGPRCAFARPQCSATSVPPPLLEVAAQHLSACPEVSPDEQGRLQLNQGFSNPGSAS